MLRNLIYIDKEIAAEVVNLFLLLCFSPILFILVALVVFSKGIRVNY